MIEEVLFFIKDECIKLVRLGICINEEICGRRTRKNAKMVKSHV